MYSIEAAATCTLCPVNTFNADEATDSELHDELGDCAACPAGQPSATDRTVCGECAKGTGRSTEDGAEGGCLICAAGYFNDAEDTSPCEPCAAGTFITDEGTLASAHESCSACPAGTHANLETAATSCTDCAAGKSQPSVSKTSCIDCAAGAIASEEGMSACEPCSPGSHANVETAATSCTDCAVGKSQPSASQTSCVDCVAGTIASEEGMSACEPCSPGSHANVETAATSCTPCAPGTYQDSLSSTSCTPCAAGRYGATEGLDSEACTRECERGYFCDAGSSSATQAPCPVGNFCTDGTRSPEVCPADYARTCDMADGKLCPDGTLCLGRRCSGLNVTENTCEMVNSEVCGSLAAAGFRNKGEFGCPPGSMCAKFQHVDDRLKTLYNLNLADAVLELIGLVVTVTYLLASYADYQKTSMYFNQLNVYVLLALDLILQIAVLVVSTDSSIVEDLEDISNSRCWGREYSTSDPVLNDLVGGMEWISILGGIELAICIIGIGSALWDRLNEDEDEEKDHSLFARIGLAISIIAIFFDVLLSSIDFFKFTIESQRDFEKLSSSLSGESILKMCMTIEDVGAPRFVVAEDNCLEGKAFAMEEEPLTEDWEVALILGCLFWAMCLLVRVLVRMEIIGSNLVGPSVSEDEMLQDIDEMYFKLYKTRPPHLMGRRAIFLACVAELEVSTGSTEVSKRDLKDAEKAFRDRPEGRVVIRNEEPL
ncbi:hypothetical protein TeGR_g4357 [Tetraparma gracilis]|nr:hypothetical protein TeGR_g4357 [Tetraparma gracilis]